MLLFLDTANLEHIRQAARLGVISGVTTNPSLLSKEGHADYKTAVLEICSIIQGPVSVEVLGQEVESMVREAREMSAWSPHVVIKIPITDQGLEALAILSKEGIKTNLTLCFSQNQALLAALAGASYISPFVGRIDDLGQDGMDLVADIVNLLESYNFPAQVIAASVRHPLHCVEAAKVGAHIATIPYSVLKQMIHHPLTTQGIDQFMNDWQKLASA